MREIKLAFLTLCTLFLAMAVIKHPIMLPAIDLYCRGLALVVFYVVNTVTHSFTINGITILHESTSLGVMVDRSCSALDLSTAVGCLMYFFVNSTVIQRLKYALMTSIFIQGANVLRVMILLISEVYINASFDFVHEVLFPFVLPVVAIFAFSSIKARARATEVIREEQ